VLYACFAFSDPKDVVAAILMIGATPGEYGWVGWLYWCGDSHLQRRPIEERKGLLAKLLHDSDPDLGIVLNKHYEEDGAVVFREACRLGCEGIVSKRLGSTYRRGRSPLWLKVKNPNAPAVKREAEEDWGR
jgi:ATP-dependent DNA ligase